MKKILIALSALGMFAAFSGIARADETPAPAKTEKKTTKSTKKDAKAGEGSTETKTEKTTETKK